MNEFAESVDGRIVLEGAAALLVASLSSSRASPLSSVDRRRGVRVLMQRLQCNYN
jgi:hypothetical protein